MANPEHLKILKQGVDVWNEWREENPEIIPDLSGSQLWGKYLYEANLCNANLARMHLHNINFYYANLLNADLSNADISLSRFRFAKLKHANLQGLSVMESDFSYCELDDVDFSEATLWMDDMSGASLLNTNFKGAEFGLLNFNVVDLSKCKGLSSVIHVANSSIGIDTIFESKGKIPESFLRGAGVPEIFITYMHSLIDENPIEFYSCFISFGEPDREFADRLYADLQAKGIRTWYWHEDHTIGAKTWKEIHQKIRLYDKLMVVCSKEALARETVIKEIERALQTETREGTEILFPIRIDNYIFEWDHYLKDELTNRNVGDFRNWDTDNGKYQKSLKRLMKGLGKKDI